MIALSEFITMEPIAYRKETLESLYVVIKGIQKNGNTILLLLKGSSNFDLISESDKIEFYQLESLLEKHQYRLVNCKRFYNGEELISYLKNQEFG